MRKRVICALVALMVIGGFFAAPAAQAKPKSLLLGMIKYFKEKGKILELRRCKDDSYDIILLRNKTNDIVFMKIKGKETKFQTPKKDYNLEEMKELKSNVSQAHFYYMQSEQAKGVTPLIMGIELRDKKGGGYEYLLHCHHPADSNYRKTWVIDVETGAVADEDIRLDQDPRTYFWSVEEELAQSNDIDKVMTDKERLAQEAGDSEAEAAAE